jgi:hypothetical protein
MKWQRENNAGRIQIADRAALVLVQVGTAAVV